MNFCNCCYHITLLREKHISLTGVDFCIIIVFFSKYDTDIVPFCSKITRLTGKKQASSKNPSFHLLESRSKINELISLFKKIK